MHIKNNKGQKLQQSAFWAGFLWLWQHTMSVCAYFLALYNCIYQCPFLKCGWMDGYIYWKKVYCLLKNCCKLMSLHSKPSPAFISTHNMSNSFSFISSWNNNNNIHEKFGFLQFRLYRQQIKFSKIYYLFSWFRLKDSFTRRSYFLCFEHRWCFASLYCQSLNF